MKVNDLLPENAKEILTEESLTAIEQAFSNKLKLTVESALAQQDDLYAKKLNQLIAAIDKDHTSKLETVIEAIDRDNTKKLYNVVRRYEKSLTNEASKFKNTLVESISDYLEEFINEAIPFESIQEATKNRTAREVLTNLRKVLAVDSALMSESVQGAVIDGKNQIDTLTQQVEKLTNENNVLKESYLKTKANLLIESKTSTLPEKKKEYIKRVLGDKTPKFIEENFDYTLKLFEKKEQERIEVIKEEAFKNRKVKSDAPILKEQVSAPRQVNPYVSELSKMK
jgi:hypothetical protein